ncbi:hypothetical protein EA187_09430 [Lujinxingia sediminis]|uniref:Uncharacterized protein n=1 Tax=Lujinxingia sediminis TaxID=2480984 RepID=A0ABY0CT28_9DELT|nr:hypothetical protein [Lujinxingia sediminis]RVU44753.1 hypothetical protein EA187_09430 [Lujinxingia sediminis]
MDDFSGGEQGASTGSKVLKFAAIGCAVIVLIGAIFAGFGAFKVVSCCGEFQELALVAEGAQEHAYEFVIDLRREDYESAYAALSATAQHELQVEDVRRAFSPHTEDLNKGMPTPFGVTLLSRNDDQSEVVWEMTTRVAEPSASHALQLRLEVGYVGGEEAEPGYGVSAWEVTRVTRSLADDPAAMMAQRFHREVANGRVEQARRYVAAESDMYGTSLEDFGERVAVLQKLGVTPAGVVAIAPRDHRSTEVTLRVLRGDGALDVVYEVSNTGDILSFKAPVERSQADLSPAASPSPQAEPVENDDEAAVGNEEPSDVGVEAAEPAPGQDAEVRTD